MRRGSPGSRHRNDEDVVVLLQKDLDIMQQRITCITGVKALEAHATVSSPFVSGIRRQTEEKKYTDDQSIERLRILEKVLSKITDFDREILRTTSPTGSSEKARRDSIDGDLFCLPTHLSVTDRLVDLYNLSLRVDPVKPLIPPPNPSAESKQPAIVLQELRMRSVPNIREVASLSAAGAGYHTALSEPQTPEVHDPIEAQLLEEEKAANASLMGKLAALTDQLNATNALLVSAQTAVVTCNGEKNLLQEQLSKKNQTYAANQRSADQQIAAAASSLNAMKAERDSIKRQVGNLEKTNRNLEERLEIEVAAHQGTIAALLAAAGLLDADGIIGRIGSSAMSGEGRAALDTLSSALNRCTDRYKREIETLTVSVESLTLELKDTLSSKNVLKEDYVSLLGRYEKVEKEILALKIQSEKSSDENNTQSQLQMSRRMSDTKIKTSLMDFAGQMKMKDEQLRMKDDQLKLKEEKIRILLASLSASTKQCSDLESVPATLKELYKTLAVAEEEKSRLKAEISRLTAELIDHKTLINTLRTKVRDLTGKDSAFLDTFEEVMQDEMLAMKWAFEAKLRVAKDKVDAMSQRHALEINRMQAQTVSVPIPSPKKEASNSADFTP